MDQHITFGLLCFTSFLTLANPLGTVPMFISMTNGMSKESRNKTAKKASVTAFLAMIIFAFFGQWIFQLFGISINGLRIVGGVLFFTMGFDMLKGESARTKQPQEGVVADEDHDISITPLGIPLICGPGTITNSIVLMEDANNDIVSTVILTVTMLLICFIIYIALRSSEQITKVLGETGNRVMVRLMGLIIMIIAVEFFFAGLKPMVKDILAQSDVSSLIL